MHVSSMRGQGRGREEGYRKSKRSLLKCIPSPLTLSRVLLPGQSFRCTHTLGTDLFLCRTTHSQSAVCRRLPSVHMGTAQLEQASRAVASSEQQQQQYRIGEIGSDRSGRSWQSAVTECSSTVDRSTPLSSPFE